MIIPAGTLFAIALTFAVGLLCGSAAWFVDLPSLLIVAVPLVFFFSVTKSGRVLGGYIKSSFIKDYEYAAPELELIAAAAKNAVKVTVAAGVFGFLAGLIALLTNLSDPQTIGPSVSVSLITLFYSVAIAYFIFFPVQAWAENMARQGE